MMALGREWLSAVVLCLMEMVMFSPIDVNQSLCDGTCVGASCAHSTRLLGAPHGLCTANTVGISGIIVPQLIT